MRILVNEKNLRIMPANIGAILPVADLTEPSALLSICRVCFTNVRAM